MQNRICELKAGFETAIGAAATAEALENLRVEYLGKKGHIAALMQDLRFAEDKRRQASL